MLLCLLKGSATTRRLKCDKEAAWSKKEKYCADAKIETNRYDLYLNSLNIHVCISIFYI